MQRQLNSSLLPPIIPKASSSLCYPPELLHPSDKIFCRFDARRKLRVNDDLRRADFPRCRHVLGNLLKSTGKIDPVFLDGSIVNLEVCADNKLKRGGIATGILCRTLDFIEYRS